MDTGEQMMSDWDYIYSQFTRLLLMCQAIQNGCAMNVHDKEVATELLDDCGEILEGLKRRVEKIACHRASTS
jgi:hypothetical protein